MSLLILPHDHMGRAIISNSLSSTKWRDSLLNHSALLQCNQKCGARFINISVNSRCRSKVTIDIKDTRPQRLFFSLVVHSQVQSPLSTLRLLLLQARSSFPTRCRLQKLLVRMKISRSLGMWCSHNLCWRTLFKFPYSHAQARQWSIYIKLPSFYVSLS